MKMISRWSLVALLTLASALLRAADLAVPFRKITFDEATQAAAKESKLVFIDFFTTWCEPCKRLDATTFTDAGVGKLVGEKAVALKLDAEKEGQAVAQRYKISAYPTLLLLKHDGSEVDRIVGFREPAAFRSEFGRLVVLAQTGKSGLDVAREAVAQQARPAAAPAADDEEAAPHFELAKKLITAGKHEEALKELLWCWDEGKKDPEFARMQRSMQVPRELSRLARDYPPAGEAMVVRRDQTRERVLANKGGGTMVQDLIHLNREMKMDEDTLAVFDQMPEGDRRKVTISIYLFDLLVEKKRYADAMLFNALDSQLMQLERAKSQMKTMAERGGDAAAQSFLRFLRTSTAKRVEALAGTGKLDQARELSDRLLAVDPSDEARDLLRQHVARAGQPDLLKLP